MPFDENRIVLHAPLTDWKAILYTYFHQRVLLYMDKDIQKDINEYFEKRIPKEIDYKTHKSGIHLRWSVTNQVWVFGYGKSISIAPSSKDYVGIGKTPSEAIKNFLSLHMLKKENKTLQKKVSLLDLK